MAPKKCPLPITRQDAYCIVRASHACLAATKAATATAAAATPAVNSLVVTRATTQGGGQAAATAAAATAASILNSPVVTRATT